MKIKTKLIHIFLSCLFLLMAGSPILAQEKIEMLKDDIYIMETILDKLLQASRNYLFKGRNIKGFYFDDYGLLFTVNLENQIGILSWSNLKSTIQIVVPNLDKNDPEKEDRKDKDSKITSIVVSPSRVPESYVLSGGGSMDEEEFDQWIKKLDKKIQTFMTSYVDVNNYLSKSDKVSVVVFLGRFNNDVAEAKIYQVNKKAITDVRKESISAKAFSNLTTKQLVSGEDHTEEIDIMSTILETALKGKKRSRYSWGNKIHGVFLKDLGVMFSFGDHFRSSSNFRLFSVPETETELKGYLLADTFMKRQQKEESEQKKQFREKLSKFEEDIIKFVGQYGSSSLKFLPNDQSVFVLFGTEGYSGGDVSNVMIRLKKSDLVDHSLNKLSLSNLIKRVQIVEY